MTDAKIFQVENIILSIMKKKAEINGLERLKDDIIGNIFWEDMSDKGIFPDCVFHIKNDFDESYTFYLTSYNYGGLDGYRLNKNGEWSKKEERIDIGIQDIHLIFKGPQNGVTIKTPKPLALC
jgi:hypothetical protein